MFDFEDLLPYGVDTLWEVVEPDFNHADGHVRGGEGETIFPGALWARFPDSD